MASFLNASGETQQLPMHVTMYREAAEAGQSLQQYINTRFPTNTEKYGSTFAQLLESEGIFLRRNAEFGIRPSTLADVLSPRSMDAATVVKDAVPTSRILFPAAIMQAVEDKLVGNLSMTATAFDSMIAFDESITGERYEQPIINMTKPEAGRSQGIAQLAQPASMMTLTTSDKAYKIPTFALGLEVSDQALRAATMDFVAMSLARQAAVQRNERAQGYMSALLLGDVDNNDGSLASLGYSTNISTLDATATGGAVTHKGWMKYLMLNGTKRTITHLVANFDSAYAIETRTGKPEIMKDDSQTSRIDTQFAIMNPTWAKNPQIFLTEDPTWPATTIMGIDRNWAIRRVRSLTADYNAIEAYVIRRSTQMRFDFGEHINRMYPEAFHVLVRA